MVIKTISGFAPYSHLAARLADVAAIILAGFAAYAIRFGVSGPIDERYLWMMLFSTLSGMIIFSASGVYRSWRGAVRVELVVRIGHGFMILGAIIFTYLYLSKTGIRFSRLWLMYWLLMAFVLSVGIRTLAYPALNRLRRYGKNRKQIILVGDIESCRTAVHAMRNNPSVGFDIARIRLMDTASGHETLGIADCRPFDPAVDDNMQADEIWICLPLSRGAVVEEVMSVLSYCVANVRYMPDMQGLRLLNHNISTVGGLYLLDMSCSPMSDSAQFFKLLEDRLLAVMALLLCSPLFLSLAIAVKLTSKGPVFYRQQRMSWNGKAFDMLKFRSMVTTAEQDGVTWGQARHKQMTPIGRWLRRTSLDELPQFINVLKGDMSIVGPRPERILFVDQFKSEIPGYMQKHMMKAGITGWAQVNGWRGDTDLKKRIEFDLWYIENWSLLLDIKIIFMTFLRIFSCRDVF
ncbi:undecaprenyl-phosphate glucose phosphotransferase [Larsenimonas rhizosphaerae]|uniref:Undecaprenyl-phosphate glucose phosphotransferase n=1 Tax=Larsenimonas rhizosphaerae TaxID=2944682 RepID=A0AA41ZGG2_9GAMM|nr:undecaprenyl-phosphate glucose phosphotransferase [Larsenimonas rhizosphaerae]MCX2524837.1 undecaprenyl-phosphate glucose phosphotransferase [Larsenimonas rhizosphaerae]